MTWFKVDDRLPHNRKARAVRKTHTTKRRDVAPFGIWVIAGALSDDGFVPLEVLEDWDDDAKTLADRLVQAGMWHTTQRDGEPGYVFHDWHDQNPARDDNDPSSAGTFGNHIRWHVQRKTVVEGCVHCPTETDDDRGDIGGDDRGDVANDRAESLPSRPVPTRPDPTPATTPLVDKPTKTDDDVSRFNEFWDAYNHKKDRKASEAKWRLALKKPGVTADLLIAAATEYVAWEREHNQGGRFIMGPAKWLLNERWNDERAARATPRSNVQEHVELARRLAEQDGATIHEIGGAR